MRQLWLSVIAFIVLVVLGAVILFAAFLPRQARLIADANLQAPERVIFIYLGDLKRWPLWFPGSMTTPTEYSEWHAPNKVNFVTRLNDFPERELNAEIVLTGNVESGITVAEWTMNLRAGKGFFDPIKLAWHREAYIIQMREALGKLKFNSEGTDPQTKAPWEKPKSNK